MSMQNEAVELEAAARAPRDVARLEESFRLFTQMTRNLETAYDALGRRAAKIDVELRRTNGELESKVRELETLTRSRTGILEALPNGVVVIDAAGAVVSVNPAAEKILGRRAQEIVGRSRDALIGPAGHRMLLAPAADDRAKAASSEREIVALDGSRRRINSTAAALPDGGELHVVTDVTVVTRLREQVARLDTLAALGEMAAGVAHEVRNPLNGIEGFASLLTRTVQTTESSEQVRRYAENIRKGVREVNAIVTNLLVFASPAVREQASFPLSAVAEEAVAEARGEGVEPAPRISLEIEPAARTAAVRGDPLKIKIVLRNLLKNAGEAVRQCGAIVVAMRLDLAARRVLVAVADDGPGLADEMLDKLFRPFSTTKASGTGLGLAIAHKLVSLHGGELRYDDARPGARFTMSLPMAAEERS